MTKCKKLALLALTLTTAACGSGQGVVLTPPPVRASTTTRTDIGATNPLCSQIRIVQLSHSDSEETKVQVIANNAALAAVCAPRPPSR